MRAQLPQRGPQVACTCVLSSGPALAHRRPDAGDRPIGLGARGGRRCIAGQGKPHALTEEQRLAKGRRTPLGRRPANRPARRPRRETAGSQVQGNTQTAGIQKARCSGGGRTTTPQLTRVGGTTKAAVAALLRYADASVAALDELEKRKMLRIQCQAWLGVWSAPHETTCMSSRPRPPAPPPAHASTPPASMNAHSYGARRRAAQCSAPALCNPGIASKGAAHTGIHAATSTTGTLPGHGPARSITPWPNPAAISGSAAP